MVKILFTYTSLLVLFFVLGCSPSQKNRSSTLILAVDKLRFGTIHCAEERKSQVISGFEVLCQEGVRYTHAFTTSTLSIPAMASLLTGLPPSITGVRTNGDFLSAHHVTLAEYANRNNIRTSFFSGGPPLTRKSNLHQGFDWVHDTWSIRTFQPFDQLAENLWTWIEDNSNPFFSFVYLNDLNFPHYQTSNSLGEPRNKSFDSQVDELDETLGLLIQKMKKKKIFDNINIIVLGLQGFQTYSEENENRLNNEIVQIDAWVKSAQKPRDEGISWTINKPVSLIDFGATIIDSYGGEIISPAISIKQSWANVQTTWPDDRLILTEDARDYWLGDKPIFYSIRKNNWAWVNGKVFNMLTDRFQNSPIPQMDKTFVQNILPEINTWSVDVLNKKNRLKDNTNIISNSISSQNFLNWLNADDNSAKLRMWKILQKEWFAITSDKKLLSENIKIGLTWDLNPRITNEPTELEKILSLPENEKIKNQLNSSVNSLRSIQ